MSQTKVPAGQRGRPPKDPSKPADYSRQRRGLRCIQGWVHADTWRSVKVYAAKHDITISDLVSCAVEAFMATKESQ